MSNQVSRPTAWVRVFLSIDPDGLTECLETEVFVTGLVSNKGFGADLIDYLKEAISCHEDDLAAEVGKAEGVYELVLPVKLGHSVDYFGEHDSWLEWDECQHRKLTDAEAQELRSPPSLFPSSVVILEMHSGTVAAGSGGSGSGGSGGSNV